MASSSRDNGSLVHDLDRLRNYASSNPNFVDLAEAYPPLKPYVGLTPTGMPIIDFKDANAQRRLTEALLYRDFGLAMVLPEDRLCPPVPNRLNYVLWIRDIVVDASSTIGTTIRGIEIGTGASAIYPLLACRLQPTWSFVATDVDDMSLTHARDNVARNSLNGRIQIMAVDSDGEILRPLFADPSSVFDFTMCNPPFYSSTDDILHSAALKEFDPNSVCTGSPNEMITDGGETAFVARMVRESMTCGDRCRWFTSLLGKLSSVSEIVHLLRSEKIENYGLTEFVQGQTRRWGIVWSHQDFRLPDALGRPLSRSLQGLVPPPGTLDFPVPTEIFKTANLSVLVMGVLQPISDLDIEQLSDLPPPAFLVSARRNTWSRAARRRDAQSMVTETPHSSEDPRRLTVLRCRITALRSVDGSGTLRAEWTFGKERAVFESFWSHVKRKVEAQMAQL